MQNAQKVPGTEVQRKAPAGLQAKGRRLWRDTTSRVEFDEGELVLLEEACRIADRLDQLHAVINGNDVTWARLKPQDDDGTEYRLVIDSALGEARQQANILKMLVVALRVPDEAGGKRPAQRPARGASKPRVPNGANVSSLDRFRRAAEA